MGLGQHRQALWLRDGAGARAAANQGKGPIQAPLMNPGEGDRGGSSPVLRIDDCTEVHTSAGEIMNVRWAGRGIIGQDDNRILAVISAE